MAESLEKLRPISDEYFYTLIPVQHKKLILQKVRPIAEESSDGLISLY